MSLDRIKIGLYEYLYSDNGSDNNHCLCCGREIYNGNSKLCGNCITELDLYIDEYLKKSGKKIFSLLSAVVLIVMNKAKILSFIKDFGSII